MAGKGGTVTLRSMKIDPKVLEEQMKPKAITEPEGPQYPYGLRVRLDNDTIEKLGLKKLPKVGDVRSLGARVKVASVSENEYDGPDGKRKHRDVELQITDMGLDGDDDDGENAESKLYAEKGD